jgi:hypothetical protein
VNTYLKKIIRVKRVNGVTQEMEHLLSKYEALSSNPSTIQKRK